MTDKELLELAAKAAGWDHTKMEVCGWFWVGNSCGGGAPEWELWNPLDDDSDALRLAVKLNMCVTSFTDEQMVGYVVKGEGYNVTENPGNDSCSATRRAIVRAAAEIGSKL